MLLVDDDDLVADPLVLALRREGYEVERCTEGAPAVAAAGDVDLVILDLGLPDIDGLEVCERIRASGSDACILMLTGRRDELDRVVVLDAGADDYLSKPFGVAELLARIRALLRRRVVPTRSSTPGDSGLRVEADARRVWAGDRELSLTPKEFGVVQLLDREAGNVVTRERLMEEVWDEHWFGSTKTLDMTVARVRQKLAEAEAPAEIVTVRGVGFRLERR